MLARPSSPIDKHENRSLAAAYGVSDAGRLSVPPDKRAKSEIPEYFVTVLDVDATFAKKWPAIDANVNLEDAMRIENWQNS
jgi:hypothetical protein